MAIQSNGPILGDLHLVAFYLGSPRAMPCACTYGLGKSQRSGLGSREAVRRPATLRKAILMTSQVAREDQYLAGDAGWRAVGDS